MTRAQRDQQIIDRIKAGEKRYVIALEFGLSPNIISRIGRKAGIPAYSRFKRTEN